MKKYCMTIMMAGLVFAGSVQTIAAQTKLRLASPANARTTYGQAQEVLKKELEKATAGRVSINIFNNSTLGSNREASNWLNSAASISW